MERELLERHLVRKVRDGLAMGPVESYKRVLNSVNRCSTNFRILHCQLTINFSRASNEGEGKVCNESFRQSTSFHCNKLSPQGSC